MDEDDTDRLARRLARRTERTNARHKDETSSSLGEIVETASRRLMTAIVVAGGLIAIGLYSTRTETPRYDAFATPDGKIVRVNTRSGTVLACQGQDCTIIVQRGQDLLDELPDLENLSAPKALPPAAPARPALPAPEAAEEKAPAEE